MCAAILSVISDTKSLADTQRSRGRDLPVNVDASKCIDGLYIVCVSSKNSLLMMMLASASKLCMLSLVRDVRVGVENEVGIDVARNVVHFRGEVGHP